MPKNYGHDFFIKHYLAQELEFTTNGLCAGLSEAARMYFLMGKEKYRRFKQLIDYVASLKPEELYAKVSQVNNAHHQSSNLSYEVNLIKETHQLFKIISIFSQPKVHRKLLGKIISQPKVMELVATLEDKIDPMFKSRWGSTKKVGSFPVMFDNKDEIAIEYLQLLNKIAKTAAIAPGFRVAFALDSINHRICLTYDGEENKWYLNDIEHLVKIGEPIPLADLGKIIFEALRGNVNEKIAAFDTAIYVIEKNYQILQKIFEDLKVTQVKLFSDKAELMVADPEKSGHSFIKKTKQGLTYAHIAAKFGYSHILKHLKAIYPKALNETSACGFTPLYVAVEQDQKDVMDMLMEGNEVQLNNKTGGRSPLYGAALSGNIETIKKLESAGAKLKPGELDLFIDHICQKGDMLGLTLCLSYLRSNNNVNKPIKSTAFPELLVTPLHIAAYRGQMNVMKILLEAKASISMEVWESISQWYKKTKRWPRILDDILSRSHIDIPPENINKLIKMAAGYGDSSGFIKLTQNYMPDRGSLNAILKKVVRQYNETIGWNVEKSQLLRGWYKVIKYLLTLDANLNDSLDLNKNLLQIAILENEAHLVKILLDTSGQKNQVSLDYSVACAENELSKLEQEAGQLFDLMKNQNQIIECLEEKSSLNKQDQLKNFISALIKDLANNQHYNLKSKIRFHHDFRSYSGKKILSSELSRIHLLKSIDEDKLLSVINHFRKDLILEQCIGYQRRLANFLSVNKDSLQDDITKEQLWCMINSVLEREKQLSLSYAI